MESIQTERNKLLKNALKDVIVNGSDDAVSTIKRFDARDIAREIGHVTQQAHGDIVQHIATLPHKEKEEELIRILAVYEQIGTSIQGTRLVLDVINQEGASPKTVQTYMPLLMNAMNSGTLEQSAESVYMVHQQGMLNLGALAAIGQGKISYLGMDGMDTRENLEVLMDSVDKQKQQGSAALHYCEHNPPATTQDPPTGATIKGLSAQATLIFKDRLLHAGEGDKAFAMMVNAWDQMYLQDAIAYNETLPANARELDISSKAFVAEVDRLDSNYFSRLAEGETVDATVQGWQTIDWSSVADPAQVTRKDIASDFFAHYAPGVRAR